MQLTWFDANSWLIEAGGRRILVDPWLVGDLVFGNAPWLVRGFRSQPIDLPQNIDLILLSQGLADHAHPETLKQLDKSIPVIASPDGAKVAESLGYESVSTVVHGETTLFGSGEDGVQVQTFVGAPVGVTKKENAYVLTFLAEGTRLYYEPHGYPDAEHLKGVDPVDVVITPMADIMLMGIAPVVVGKEAAPKLANLLKPQVMLPTAEAGRAEYSGLLASALSTSGGADELKLQFANQSLNIEVVQPISGQITPLTLRSAATV
ncbi:MAG: MBL fold metallo-hydrolase [Cyanobacteria bacterium P01_D01_bin.36]